MVRMNQAIQDTLDCYRVCEETIQYCSQKGGKHTDPQHIQALTDCKEACKMAANFMIRGSELHGKVCGVCADACKRCAESCEAMGDDEQMKKCAEICRKCEASCRPMGSM